MGNANGGYLPAIAARAPSEAADGRIPASITAHFLAPGRPGPVGVDTYVEKRGRRFTTVSAKMADETRPVLAMLGSFADRDTDSHPVTTQPRAHRCRRGGGLARVTLCWWDPNALLGAPNPESRNFGDLPNNYSEGGTTDDVKR